MIPNQNRVIKMYYVGQYTSHLRTVSGRGTPKIARPRPGGGPRVAKELRWRNESFKTIVPGGARRLRWCYRKRELCTKTSNTILYNYILLLSLQRVNAQARRYLFLVNHSQTAISDAVAADRNARRNAPRPEYCVSV